MTVDPSKHATRSSWAVHPPPDKRAALTLAGTYSPAEFERIAAGRIPRDMGDKWFIFFEAPWLYLHRSWTGFCIYAVRLEASPAGANVIESWVNRDAEQYSWGDIHRDEQILAALINGLLTQDR